LITVLERWRRLSRMTWRQHRTSLLVVLSRFADIGGGEAAG
jgi:hypothetical protein